MNTNLDIIDNNHSIDIENNNTNDNNDKNDNPDNNKPKKLPFKILLGDTSDFMIMLKNVVHKRIMAKDNWELYKTNNAFYWILDEKVTSIVYQWMIYRNPIIYLFFNYRNKTAMESLKRVFEISKKDTKKSKHQYVIVGTNYLNRLKQHKKLKKDIISWCLTTFGEEQAEYLDLEHIEL